MFLHLMERNGTQLLQEFPISTSATTIATPNTVALRDAGRKNSIIKQWKYFLIFYGGTILQILMQLLEFLKKLKYQIIQRPTFQSRLRLHMLPQTVQNRLPGNIYLNIEVAVGALATTNKWIH